MNRRQFTGFVMAIGVGGYGSGKKEFVGFKTDDVSGCSRVYFPEGRGGERFFANLKSGRQVEITELDFEWIFNNRHKWRGETTNAQST